MHDAPRRDTLSGLGNSDVVLSFRGSSLATSQQHVMNHFTKVAPLQRTRQALRNNCIQSQSQLSLTARRNFSSSFARHTDGVFRELTSMRVRTPWVEALRAQQQGGQQSGKPAGEPELPKYRDLPPKKRMSDSYHSVVLPLARDPWLLDTYLNSSGHIRLGTIFMDLDALSGVIA